MRSTLNLDAIAETVRPDCGALPLPQVIGIIAKRIQAALVLDLCVELLGHSIYPADDAGDFWGTNPYGQDFMLKADDGRLLSGSLHKLIMDLLRGQCYGLCPPEEDHFDR